MRTFCIGDIHGAYLALKNLLDQVNFDFNDDKLIVLGDVCDGWSQTPEAIELLMKIKNLVYIQGNHDEWTVKFLNSPMPKFMDSSYDSYRAWFHHGGKATLDAYERCPELIVKHTEFLANSPVFYIDENNNLFVHAGFQPGCVNDDGSLKTGEFYKDVYLWDRDFWNAMYAGKNLAKNFNKVYIGHTPTLNYPNNIGEHLKPIIRKNVINMDTGSAFTGKLSMMNIDTGELFQSEKRSMEYYPYEFGRNQKAFARQ